MRRSIVSAAILSGLALSQVSCAQEVNTADKEAVEEIVRAYLLENPEVIIEALEALEEKRKAEESVRAREAVIANSDAIYNDARHYSIGPDDADVTIVEFFDYRCGPCRGAAPWINAAPAKYDGKVRVVFKEFPILSPESQQAALAALAAGEQGKYPEMHRALMADRSGFKDADIDRVAASVGVDVAKMREDMKSPALSKALADTQQLARTVGVNSTPTFIVNGEVFSGLDRERIERLIEEGQG